MIPTKRLIRFLIGPLTLAVVGAFALFGTAAKVSAGPYTYEQWTGEGDGTTWEDPLNWRSGTGDPYNGTQWPNSNNPSPEANGGPMARWQIGYLPAGTDPNGNPWPEVAPVVDVTLMHTLNNTDNGSGMSGATINITTPGAGLILNGPNTLSVNGLSHDARWAPYQSSSNGAWIAEAGRPDIINISNGGLLQTNVSLATTNSAGVGSTGGTYGNLQINVTDKATFNVTNGAALILSAPTSLRSGIGLLHITGYDPASSVSAGSVIFQGLSATAQSNAEYNRRSNGVYVDGGSNIGGNPPTPYAAEFDVTLDATNNTRGTNAGGANMPLFDTMAVTNLTIQNSDSTSIYVGNTYPTHFGLSLAGYNPVVGDIIALITSTNAINANPPGGGFTPIPGDNYFYNTPWDTDFMVSGDTFKLEDNVGGTNGVFLEVVAIAAEAETVPEPSTVVLGLVGLVGVGLLGWRNRRRAAC